MMVIQTPELESCEQMNGSHFKPQILKCCYTAIDKGNNRIYIYIYRLYIYITFSLFIHLSMDSQVVSIFAIVNSAAMKWECRYLFKMLVSFPLDIYPEVGLLDGMILLFLIFLGTFILFSRCCTNLHSHEQCARVPFLHILTNTCYLLSF